MNCHPLRQWFASLLWLVAATAVAVADSAWSLRSWQTAEGLPDNCVVGIEQTPDGFLWVGTQGGLVRFDGVRFQEFAPVAAAGEPTSLIQALFLDRRGRLWVAKERGVLVCIDRGRTTTFTSLDGLLPLEVRMLVEDAEGALWVSYLGGDLLRLRGGRGRALTSEDGLPPGGTCQLATHHDGGLWWARGSQVGVFRRGQFLALTNLPAQRIVAARAGGIWTCMGVNLSRYREGGGVQSCGSLPTELRDVSPTVLFEDRSGALWIGTRNAGLFRYSGASCVRVATSHDEIRCLTEDREGNLWVGTRGGGLNRLRPSVVKVVDAGSWVPFEAVRSVCQDSSGVVWAVAQSGAVVRQQEATWNPLRAGDGWLPSYAQCIAADAGGGVWIGTQYKGLHRWREGAVVESYSATNGLAADFVGSLLTTGSGDVWVGTESPDTLQHALQRRRAGQWRRFDLPARSGNISAMALDAAGHFWAGTSAGLLLRVSDDALVNETSRTLSVPQAIRSLHSTSDGSIWIGYAGRGVGRLKAGQFTLCQHEHGLHDDYISQIVADGCGRLWFASNRGIFYVKQTDLDEFMAGRAPRVRSVVYGRNEGLPGTQASYGYWPGAMAGRDGRLWIPMQSGLAVVQAKDSQDDPEPPPVVIERVISDEQTVAAYEPGVGPAADHSQAVLDLRQAQPHVRLRPGYQQVQFEFTALTFAAPANVEFKYRLAPLDADWVPAVGRRVAYYPHIPPGEYRFQVVACRDAGGWNEPGATLALTAEPHFWQTAWFQIAVPVSVLSLLAGAVLVTIRRRHQREVEHLELERGTERERSRIAQDLHDDLGAGLTQISLNTALAQSPGMAPEVSGGLLQEIDQRACELVTALDEIVWAVNPKNDTVPALARYLCQFAQSCLFPAGMACRLDVSPDLPEAPVGAEQRHQLFLAFKEALNNALQHSGGSELQLEIKAGAETLTVALTDNGRGFASGPAREGADGLKNMHERMKRLGGRCAVTSGPDKGTSVVLTLPLEAERK